MQSSESPAFSELNVFERDTASNCVSVMLTFASFSTQLLFFFRNKKTIGFLGREGAGGLFQFVQWAGNAPCSRGWIYLLFASGHSLDFKYLPNLHFSLELRISLEKMFVVGNT